MTKMDNISVKNDFLLDDLDEDSKIIEVQEV